MDVSLALGISCGLISEFERCILSPQRMSKLKPLLQKYIEGDAKLGKKFALEKSLERVLSNTSSGMYKTHLQEFNFQQISHFFKFINADGSPLPKRRRTTGE